jgi:hypothetical protein
MKIPGYVLIAALVLFLAVVAGCTTPQQPAATQSPTAAAQQTYQAPVSTQAAASSSSADLDTKIRVRFNELACVNVGDYLGVTYLYPDQKFRLEAEPAGQGIDVNVLFVDENDQLALRQAKPKWNSVSNKWMYESVVPLAQLDNVNTHAEKSFTIKRQSKYYICADDRKESGTQDITYQVPVRLTEI